MCSVHMKRAALWHITHHEMGLRWQCPMPALRSAPYFSECEGSNIDVQYACSALHVGSVS